MQESKDAGKNVTVTGCLKAGDSADSFSLSDLKWGRRQGRRNVGRRYPATAITATSLKVIGSP